MPPVVPTAVAFDAFVSRLQSSGLREALRHLLELTDYRFIGIFRFRDDQAYAVVHYDRLNPDQTEIPSSPIGATYCCYVRDSRGVFTVADALDDPRVIDHPKRRQLRAYCGVPILTPEGELIGSLCHYDEGPRDAEQIDLPLILQVCSRLAWPGVVPPPPNV